MNGCGLSSFVLCVISWSSGSINKILLSFVCQHHTISYTLSISDWILVMNVAHMCKILLNFCITKFQGFIYYLFIGIDWWNAFLWIYYKNLSQPTLLIPIWPPLLWPFHISLLDIILQAQPNLIALTPIFAIVILDDYLQLLDTTYWSSYCYKIFIRCTYPSIMILIINFFIWLNLILL